MDPVYIQQLHVLYGEYISTSSPAQCSNSSVAGVEPGTKAQKSLELQVEKLTHSHHRLHCKTQRDMT